MAAADNEKSRLDEAARAGWLYFIAGHTQDEIAKMLQVSRASAQRLVSLCLAERLITFRLEHPIAACMELAARLKDLFHLAHCEVVPTDPTAPLSAAGIAERGANILESTLRTEKPAIVALGGAFVPILGDGSLEDFGLHWTQWFASNSLGSLALGPIALILLAEPPLPSAPARRTAEALVIGTALVVVCTIAFEVSAGTFDSGFLPALLYSHCL